MVGESGQAGAVGELAELRSEVTREIELEEALLQKLSKPRRGDRLGHVLTLALMSFLIILVFLRNEIFYLLLIVAILLYSYNFLLLLMPTTTERIRPEEKGAIKNIDREKDWLAIKLLAKKRRLAIEIGLTVFLGGMVPLSLSFTVIFGLILAVAFYLGFMVQFLAAGTVWTIATQIGFILLFYLMVVLLEPQSQGVTRVASAFKKKIGTARDKGISAFLILMMALVGIILAASILTLGALLLPGQTVANMFNTVGMLTDSILLSMAVVTACLLVTMRHLQGVASRWMAVNIIISRLERLRGNVAVPLAAVDELPPEEQPARLTALKKEFYSVVIYDVIEHDFFGRSQVYLVGPRLRYVLDEHVLAILD